MTDYRLLSLLIPAAASGLGFFCFAVLAFSFTELAALPEAFRTGLVLVGAVSLAFGAEVGTLANVVEIYRKGDKLHVWDACALGISVIATIGAFILSFATLLGVTATWGSAVKLWGPIFLGLFAALDSYGGFMELGIYLRRKLPDAQAQLAAQLRFELWRKQTIAQHEAQLSLIAGADDTAATQLAAQLRTTNAQLDAADAQVRQLQAQVAASAAQPDGVGGQVREVAGESALLLSGKRAAIVKFYASNPRASQGEAAQVAGCTRQHVGKVLAQLESAGVIRRNGNGVEVL